MNWLIFHQSILTTLTGVSLGMVGAPFWVVLLAVAAVALVSYRSVVLPGMVEVER